MGQSCWRSLYAGHRALTTTCSFSALWFQRVDRPLQDHDNQEERHDGDPLNTLSVVERCFRDSFLRPNVLVDTAKDKTHEYFSDIIILVWRQVRQNMGLLQPSGVYRYILALQWRRNVTKKNRQLPSQPNHNCQPIVDVGLVDLQAFYS